MKTINKILRYNLTETEIKALYDCGICNGIGGKGSNIEKILQDNLMLLPHYNDMKHGRLLQDLTRMSVCHDLDFKLGLGFYKANYRFAYGVYQLTNWSSFWKRIGMALITFIVLNKYGKEYYGH